MIKLSPEDHAAAAKLASEMKSKFSTVAPKISIAAVHMLQLEIAVHLAAGKKKAALDMVKAMNHDMRDSIRAYFRAVEERKKSIEATQAAMREADKAGPQALDAVVIDEAAAVSSETWNKLAKDDA